MPTWPRTTSHKTGGKTTGIHKKVSQREKALRTIYSDDNGDMPPMRALERRRGSGRAAVLTLIVILLGIAGVIAWKQKGGQFNFNRPPKEQTVAVAVAGEKEAQLLSPYRFTVNVDPGNTAVKNAALSVFLPTGFDLTNTEPTFTETPGARERVWRIAPEDFKKNPAIKLEGVFLGNLNEQKTIRAVLTYTPRNFDSEFQTNTIHTVELKTTPLAFNVTGPEQIRGGEPVVFTANIKNSGNEKLAGLTIKPPTGKTFALTDDKTAFTIAELDKNTQLSREFHGSFASDMEGSTALAWTITMSKEGAEYVIAAASPTVAVSPQPLILTIALDNNPETVSPGDVLKGEVRYHNKSAKAVEKAKLVLSIDAPAKKRNSILEWDRIETTGSPAVEGVQQTDTVRRGVITWSYATIPTLETIAPNQSGILSFSIPIKTSEKFDYTPIGAASIALSFEVQAAGDQTATAQPITLPLAADTRIAAGAVKTGDAVTLQWTMNHHFHNISGVQVQATLFGTIEWLNQTDTSDGTVTYDPIRRAVTWDIPAFAATEGVATANFSIKIKSADPTQTALMSETALTATDDILARSITRKATEVKMPR